MPSNMIDPRLQDSRPEPSRRDDTSHKLRLGQSPSRGPRSDANSRSVQNRAGNSEETRPERAYAGERQFLDDRQQQLHHRQQEQLQPSRQQQERRTFYSQEGQSSYTPLVYDEGEFPAHNTSLNQYQQYAPPPIGFNGYDQYADLQSYYRQPTVQPVPQQHIANGLHAALPSGDEEAEPLIDNPPLDSNATEAERPVLAPEFAAPPVKDVVVLGESPANPAIDTILQVASPTLETTGVPAELTAALLALDQYRASEGGQMETDEHDADPATSNGVQGDVASPAKEIHPVGLDSAVSLTHDERPRDTVLLEVVAMGTDRPVESAVMEAAVVAEAAVDTESVVDAETLVLAETTGRGRGLQLEGIENVQVDMDIYVDEDEDKDKAEALANASRCSTPLTPCSSDMEDINSDPEDVRVEELAVMNVDVTPKGKQVAASTPQGKKPVSRRTKGKEHQKSDAEQAVDSAFDTGSGEEGRAWSGRLQAPPMSPAVAPSPFDGVIPIVDINQQTEFSPLGYSTRFTRSRRREASVVPKSEIVPRGVTPVVEDQRSPRRSGRRAAPAESLDAVSTASALDSPAQAVAKLPPRKLDNRNISGTATGGITGELKPKRTASSRWHKNVTEYRDAEGNWRDVDAQASQQTTAKIAEVDNQYFTQSGRAVKRRDPSAAPKEVSTTLSRRADLASLAAEPVDKAASSSRPRTTASKPKPSKPDRNQARSSRTTRAIDPPRDRSATVGTRQTLPVIERGTHTVGYESTTEAPLRQTVESETSQGAGPHGCSPPRISHADGIYRFDEGMIPTPVASLYTEQPIANNTTRAPSATKGKRATQNPRGVELSGQPLPNGSGSRGTFGTGQQAVTRPNASSFAMQLQELRERQSVVDAEFLIEQQHVARGLQTLATGIENLAAGLQAGMQNLTAELQAISARSQAISGRMNQSSLAQQERISRMEEQCISQMNLTDLSVPPKSARSKTGMATTKTRDPAQKQGPRRKKVDKPLDNDPEFPSSKHKRKAMPGTERPVDEQRASKRARSDRANKDAYDGVDFEELDRDTEEDRLAEEVRQSFIGKSEELQQENCTLPRYSKFRQCKHCASLSSADKDNCRFKGWRVFQIDSQTGLIVGEPWFEHQVGKNEELVFPVDFNTDFTAQQSFRMKETVVKALLPLITKELGHCIRYGAKRKAFEIGTRSTCDRCSMTIFGGSWSCVACGKEYCFECELEMSDKPPVSVGSYQNDGGRLYQCSKGSHARINLFATTIFDLNVLQFHWLQMIGFAERAGIPYDKEDVQQLLPKENVAQVLFPTINLEVEQPGEAEERARATATGSITKEDLEHHLTTKCHDTLTPPSELDEGFKGHPFYRLEASKMKEALFDRMWQEGTPVVIDNAGQGLTEDWTPQGFKDSFGDEHCYVFDCQAEVAEDSTIKDFYSRFNAREENTDEKVLKLKDWPWNTEFKEHCPSLYEDFLHSLPVPDYTRRDGVTNISAFFPTNTTPPDIGPKLYSALRGKQTEGGKGSTRMHMDIADAINVMTYASKREDGTEGCALWHIYRKEDLDTLRKFLKEKFGNEHSFTDPVHSQIFYLDTKLRKELFDKTGVSAYRIYQYPGQAVMIPAYCAHQVCNLSDCIKIACDFVSPHSISRCAKITEEFRGENVVSDWKDDVLQLNNMMWYTWLFCQKFDVEHQNAPALPFDETTVGAFIEENSKEHKLSKSGLAHLKPTPQASGRIPQVRASKATTPIWARRPESATKPPAKLPPRRGIPSGSVPASSVSASVQRISTAQSGILQNLQSPSNPMANHGAPSGRPMQLPRWMPHPPVPVNQPMFNTHDAVARRDDAICTQPPVSTMTGHVSTAIGGSYVMTGNTTLPMANAAMRPESNHNPNAIYYRPALSAQHHGTPVMVPNIIQSFPQGFN